MSVDHLTHVQALLLLAHVVVDHLDVLHSATLLGVLGQGYRALILGADMVNKILGVTD
jgi:hypothetical protein